MAGGMKIQKVHASSKRAATSQRKPAAIMGSVGQEPKAGAGGSSPWADRHPRWFRGSAQQGPFRETQNHWLTGRFSFKSQMSK